MTEQQTAQTTQPGTPATGVPAPSGTARPVRSVAFWIIVMGLVVLWMLGWRYHAGGLWIHLLLGLALVVALFELLTGRGTSKDIRPEKADIPKWNPQDPENSLRDIFRYVVDEAGKSTDWYWRAKRSKASTSQVIRFLALVLTAVGGLLPVIANLIGSTGLNNGLWASLMVGIAAALFGLDKAFGYSSGWARYVLTATNIKKALEEFRMEWAELRAKAGPTLTIDNVAPMIARARQFRSDVEALVLQETKDWVSEFQNSIAQMEKDIAAQMSALKTQVDKTIAAREAAAQPGSIQLTIQNPGAADPGSIQVTLTAPDKTVVQEPVTGNHWARIAVAPGSYDLKVAAKAGEKSLGDHVVVSVEAGKVATIQSTLT